ncbi:MAG: FISUMP domain-containing protein [Bacteroidales bacterium]|nr:hypothetical protein [Lentimicrobiaceae bacterium]MDD5694899.1 FISUMP domain-containing protein [Bacteroidales bacterium]
MKPRLILLFALIIPAMMAAGQPPVMKLTFTAVNNIRHVQMDRIWIINRTLDTDTTLIWPDTLLVANIIVGLPEYGNPDGFRLYQNHPNPAGDRTTFHLAIPQQGQVNLMVTDIVGRTVFSQEFNLAGGNHTFTFAPGKETVYFISAVWKGERQTIKTLNYVTDRHQKCLLEYAGTKSRVNQPKAGGSRGGFMINPGDEMLYIAYLGSLESGITDSIEGNQTYTFQFAAGIPCPEQPTVAYKGQVYNTVQVFNQCWLKENLNAGEMITGTTEQSDNGTMEKYCFGDEPDSCAKYGGLYQMNEMMQYNAQQGSRGICPRGWHVPTDGEWKMLEGEVDTYHGIAWSGWDDWADRGYDAGRNLRTTSGWYNDGNGTDLFGFKGLPGGKRNHRAFFEGTGKVGYWWTSTIYEITDTYWTRYVIYDESYVYRIWSSLEVGLSVRCLRDKDKISPITLTFNAVSDTTHVQPDSIRILNKTQGVEARLIWPDTTLILETDLLYDPDDVLMMIGYSDTLASGIYDSPEASQSYTFQFATNIPCPGAPTVEYEGQVYNTIQIFSQCWLKENLNVGGMIPGTTEQSNNGTIEKYCFDNDPDSCAKYGGLYQWNEMMQYDAGEGVQGICPPGWHIPLDVEWKVLEGAVDSLYGIGDPEWDIPMSYRGYDAGRNLKTTDGWSEGSDGIDRYGFSGMPAGMRSDSGIFSNVATYARWWSSTGGNDNASWVRSLYYTYASSGRSLISNAYGHSVRCLRDQ